MCSSLWRMMCSIPDYKRKYVSWCEIERQISLKYKSYCKCVRTTLSESGNLFWSLTALTQGPPN